MSLPVFADRRHAGRQLGVALTRFADAQPLLLALPRGGVPVAFEVAEALQVPLGLLLVRKIAARHGRENGVGTAVGDSVVRIMLNDDAMHIVDLPAGHVEAERDRRRGKAARYAEIYLDSRSAPPTTDRVVIVVDDGTATGGTAEIAVEALRRGQASQVVLAVPIAPADIIETLRREADEVVCLGTPEPFDGVDRHYADFEQTTDEEVIRLLAEARARRPGDRRP